MLDEQDEISHQQTLHTRQILTLQPFNIAYFQFERFPEIVRSKPTGWFKLFNFSICLSDILFKMLNLRAYFLRAFGELSSDSLVIMSLRLSNKPIILRCSWKARIFARRDCSRWLLIESIFCSMIRSLSLISARCFGPEVVTRY